ncbi:hypothetical protein [Conexibacter woesei]|uniref:Uncharacterized protein n=1 Tax=Conexibacter woesei (strain DSM 14684 / CCUG 47730 / CIP 108061 / JCM 11494 / NBRC 100937 / ID131577) TaxID=469383 RepID=D3F152_CONWI|nr:hypothetical protein [Conexibacter woesei]ADB50128.1 conserved hypothetical protein [Conexibacter woesei DSM 14684]
MSSNGHGRRAVGGAGGVSAAAPQLSGGMVIAADVEARVLGLRLLTLSADVAVTPSRLAAVGGRRPRVRPRPAAGSARGGGLALAARAIESGADDLRIARDQMP